MNCKSSPERGGSSSSDGGSHLIKTCADCGTTKTPLWRGGPAGPKVYIIHFFNIFHLISPKLSSILSTNKNLVLIRFFDEFYTVFMQCLWHQKQKEKKSTFGYAKRREKTKENHHGCHVS